MVRVRPPAQPHPGNSHQRLRRSNPAGPSCFCTVERGVRSVLPFR